MKTRTKIVVWFLYVTSLLWFAGIARGAEPELYGPPELILYDFADRDEMPCGTIKMKWERPCHQIEHGFWSDWYPAEYWVFIDCGDTDDKGQTIYIVKRVSYDDFLRMVEGNYYPYCG